MAINVLANDFDPDGDSLSVASVTQPANGSATIGANGVVTYDPRGGFVGADALRYTACDPGGLCASARITVTVAPRNGSTAANKDQDEKPPSQDSEA